MFLVSRAWAGDLTLVQALTAAADKHPSVQVRIGELQAAGKDVDASLWGRFPRVSVQATSSQGQPQAAMVLQQPLWADGKIDAQISLSEAARLKAEAARSETWQSLLLQTSNSFFEVLRLRTRLALVRENEQEHKKLLDMMDRRVKSEISPVADLVLAQARLQQAVSDRIQFDRALQNALLALDQFAGPLPGAPRVGPITGKSVAKTTSSRPPKRIQVNCAACSTRWTWPWRRLNLRSPMSGQASR